jgi:hypothetical protein
LILKNCRELFTKDEFDVYSDAIELIGFDWFLNAATEEKSFLALWLNAVSPDGFEGNYRIGVDWLVIRNQIDYK